MNKEFLEDLHELLEREKLKRKLFPIGIELNEDWYRMNQMLGNIHVSHIGSQRDFGKALFRGLPVYFNNEIDTYRFVYEDEDN